MAELIAEEDEKAAELSNGIVFVEEESNRCDRDRDCRSRKSALVLFYLVNLYVQYEDSAI